MNTFIALDQPILCDDFVEILVSQIAGSEEQFSVVLSNWCLFNISEE